MSDRNRKTRLVSLSKGLGIEIEVSKPWDGVARYWFMKDRRTLFIALGITRAEVFLAGYSQGLTDGRLEGK